MPASCDVVLLLARFHREVAVLLERFCDCAEADDATRALVLPLVADALVTHALLEERHLRPVFVALGRIDLAEGAASLSPLRRVLAPLLGVLPPAPDRLRLGMEELAARFRRHQVEQEGHGFQVLVSVLDETQREALGRRMLGQLVELEGSDPRWEIVVNP
jgi:hypothetical protein